MYVISISRIWRVLPNPIPNYALTKYISAETPLNVHPENVVKPYSISPSPKHFKPRHRWCTHKARYYAKGQCLTFCAVATKYDTIVALGVAVEQATWRDRTMWLQWGLGQRQLAAIVGRAPNPFKVLVGNQTWRS